MADQIGKYGGTLTAQATSKASWDDVIPSFLLDDAMILSNDTSQILPGWAKSWSAVGGQEDAHAELPKGHEVVRRRALHGGRRVVLVAGRHEQPPGYAQHLGAVDLRGEPLQFVKVDDLTLQIKSKDPYPSLPFLLAQYYSQEARMFEPKHYLQKWHITYNAQANNVAKQEGSDDGPRRSSTTASSSRSPTTRTSRPSPRGA